MWGEKEEDDEATKWQEIQVRDGGGARQGRSV